jgi:hypothetical protein
LKLEAIFQADKRREDGAWMDSPNVPGLKLKVRGLGSTAHAAAQDEFWGNATDEHKKLPDINERAVRHVIRKALLIDWNLEDEFNEDNVKAVLGAKLFRDEVTTLADKVAAQGRDQIEAEKGN